jgi:flagellar biosynthesis/type III secretory pathway protein FliH
MSDPKWLAKAEELAAAYTCSRESCSTSSPCVECKKECVRDFALALEEAYAEGRAKGRSEQLNAAYTTLDIEAAVAAGKAEGRREGMEMVEKLSKKLAEARDRGYNEGPFL